MAQMEESKKDAENSDQKSEYMETQKTKKN